MNLENALGEPLRSCRPVKVLQRSLEKNRLAHGILLHGRSLATLEEVALALAGVLLENPAGVSGHPDLFTLRPSHKARQIRIDATRELIRAIQHSPSQGSRKVAIIYEAERMNIASANAFLKTLEEPPADTNILLLTTRPYNLLDTIRSRAFSFRLPVEIDLLADEDWQSWLDDYKNWLANLVNGPRTSKGKADMVLALYGLVGRFLALQKTLADSAWKDEKDNLPVGMTDEETEASKSGLSKGIRQRLFREIENQTRSFVIDDGKTRNDVPIDALAGAIKNLEKVAGLVEVNLADGAALEFFLLASLRLWTARANR